jgi:hypothetical protein
MTPRPEDDENEERRLTRLVSDALGEAGELIPTTSGEVQRAEAEGIEHEGPLPRALRELRPAPRADETPAKSVAFIDQERRRRGGGRVVSHAFAAALGALAAAAAVLLAARLRTGSDPAGAPTADRWPNAPDAGPPEKRIAVAVDPCPTACCAGSACPRAKDAKSCSSGRTCIACSLEAFAGTRYRIRLGAFSPTDPGRAALESAKDGLDLCVRVASSELVCTPAFTPEEPGERWTTLPMLPSAEELAAGFELRVRPRGAPVTLAELRTPIQVNPALLCKGMLLRPLPLPPKRPDGAPPPAGADAGAEPGSAAAAPDPLGVVSLFLDDPYFVEVARAASVATLRAARGRFDLTGGRAFVFETKKADAEHFALVLGPFDKQAAERVRWQVLEQNEHARVETGEEHVGAPLPIE